MTQITPEQEDPIVHGYLASLPSFSPRLGFADRVLMDVRRPAPSWVRSAQLVYRTVFNRQTRWVWALGATASAAFSFAVYFSLAVTHWDQVQAAWATFVRTGLPEAWQALAGASASAATTLLSVAEPFTTLTGLWPAAVGGSVLVMMGSAWGLRRTVREFQAERVPFRAAR